MTTLEKMAKAMFENVRARAKQNGLVFGSKTQWEELPDWAQKEYTGQVRAVLEALKNSSALKNNWNDQASPISNWNKALDAILRET